MIENKNPSTEIIQEEQISAFILNTGDIVDVKKSQISSGNTKGSDNTIDLDEDEFGEQYAAGRVYKPTLAFSNMKQFSIDNLYHSKCMNQKAVDCCFGWDIVNVNHRGVVDTSKEKKWSVHDNKLFDFFQESFGMDDFIEGVKSILVNLDTFGVVFFELTRTKAGAPKRLKLLPTETCRLARDLTSSYGLGHTDMKYVMQVVNTHERIFKLFDGEIPKHKEPHTNRPMTEVFMIRHYHVMGGKYGIPDWVPALKSMIGNDKVADYNVNFFNNEAVPRFAVIVQGGKLDDDTKRDIKAYFRKDLKGVANAHKTLVLTSPKGTEIKLLPLAFEMKDGGFRFYRKDNRDEIISGHGMPPHRVQVYDSGNSGSISPGMLFNLDKTYKYSVIEPAQRKLEHILNRIIKLGFNIRDKQIKFRELDIGEEADRAVTLKTIASAHEKYYNMGSMTADEIRKDNKQKTYNELPDIENDVKEWAKTPKPVYLLRQAKLAEEEAKRTSGGSNLGASGLNETPNDFGDKSQEATGKDSEDKKINNLLMKRQLNEVCDKVDSVLSKIDDIEDAVEGVSNDKC